MKPILPLSRTLASLVGYLESLESLGWRLSPGLMASLEVPNEDRTVAEHLHPGTTAREADARP
jgi:hypothetical protein